MTSQLKRSDVRYTRPRELIGHFNKSKKTLQAANIKCAWVGSSHECEGGDATEPYIVFNKSNQELNMHLQ